MAERMRYWTVLAATVSLVGALLAAAGCSGNTTASNTNGATGPAELTRALAAVENEARYRQSDWGYSVLDQQSGQVLAAQNDQKMFDPGSTMKTYSVSTALRLYPSNYQFRTPVYREGTVTGSILNGDLVLVASGDMSLGLREQPNGTLYYENLPDIDQSYANIGLPGAVEPPGNPLSGLDQLADAVRSSGITRITGDVAIDDRLFTPYNGFPDGLISPIWVNENLIDVLVTPGAIGQPGSINWRPMTASYTVQNQVNTVDATKASSLKIDEPAPGKLVVTGQIPAGSRPTLVVKEVDNPSAFARTAFIEALQRAGVTVTATPTGPNPEALLPAKDSYQPANRLGEHVSATLAQFANLIMKVSYNRGADLMTCLSAVKMGSTDCQQGLVAEAQTITGFGIPTTSVFLFDGAGSNDQGRTTPAALAQFLKGVAASPYAKTLADALPVLGRSGTMANVLPQSPAAGQAQVKTGNRILGTAADQIIVLGNSLAGYIHTKSGRRVTFMIAVGNVPVSDVAEVLTVTTDQARMVESIQQSL
jgi:D-alanyl-D-alanine carboxypeptidase/D-alanyl-D-alanine-endopeptidase (penicillin-binding protein 4)